MERLKNTLEIASNIAVVLVAVAVLSVIAIIIFSRPAQTRLLVGLNKGDLVVPVATVDYRTSERTLLIALNTNCSACTEAVPLYRRLMDDQQQRSKPLRIVGLFPNKSDEVANFVKNYAINFDTVSEVDLASLRISGTPTMILVNSQGRVENFWLGKLAGTEADEFIRVVNAEQ